MQEPAESVSGFHRGRYRGLIVAVVVVVLGVAAVLALSGVFAKRQPRAVLPDEPDNKEGGCPCQCDRSEAMTAELRSRGGDAALRDIDESLATIAEREAAGYVTDAMIAHRLRLIAVERELQPGSARARVIELAQPELELDEVDHGRLRAGMDLVVHGQTTEWVRGRQKQLRACFVLTLQLENVSDRERLVKAPAIASQAALPISRWYVRGEHGEPWDGRLKPRERKSVHVIGYAGEGLEPRTRVEATVHFEGSSFRLSTRARSRWNQPEPTHALR